MRKVFKYTLVDLARNRFVLAFAFLLFLMAEGLFQLEDDPIKALLSLVQIVLAAGACSRTACVVAVRQRHRAGGRLHGLGYIDLVEAAG